MPRYLLGVAAAIAVTLGAAPATQPDGVNLVLKRFLRPGGMMLVNGFCEVPFDRLQPIGAVGGDEEVGAVYTVSISVRDSNNLVLHRSDWSQEVPKQALGFADASTVEHFTFAVPEGRYAVEITLTDSSSGLIQRASADVVSLGPQPNASDLIVSYAMRRSDEPDEDLAPGEIRKGSFIFSAATKPALTPRQASLFYYLELYPGDAHSVPFSVKVLAEDGSVITRTEPEHVQATAAGGIAARALDLTGLPPGEYSLEVTAGVPGHEIMRSAAFSMAGFDTEAVVAQAGATSFGDELANMNELQLDSLYSPLVYLMEAEERGIYDGLSLLGKRNYLRRFWAKRDPVGNTSENEALVAYYRGVAEATRRFRESGAGDVPGWRTDRGRVFLRRGEPEDVLRRPQAGATMPFEVWKYTRPRPLKYVFLDETGLGNYALIYTNDRFETGRPDWAMLLGREAVLEVERF